MARTGIRPSVLIVAGQCKPPSPYSISMSGIFPLNALVAISSRSEKLVPKLVDLTVI